MNFEDQLNNSAIPIAVDFDASKDTLLIAFGGLAHMIGFPIFEFNRITSGLKRINKIYLRDPYRLWFHRGLPGIGSNINSISNHLRRYTMHPSTKRVITLGNSGGGYAALLFGHILQADEAHAFVPKTHIYPFRRLLKNDIPDFIRRSHVLSLYIYGQRRYFDLKKYLATPQNQNGYYHVYFPTANTIDNFHATRIMNIPNVHLHPYEYDKHNLINILKSNGELIVIIERAIS